MENSLFMKKSLNLFFLGHHITVVKFKRKSSWKAVSYSDRVAFRAQDCDITAYFATILAWIFELVGEILQSS